MPTSADGILTCTFDPERVAVQIEVDGTAWPVGSGVSRVTITRAAAGQGAIPVRDLERRSVAGGTLLWADNEAPLDVDVVYSCTGYDSLGDEVRVGVVNRAPDPRLTATTMSTNGATVADTRPATGGPDGGAFFRRTMTTANTTSPMTMALSGSGLGGIPVAPGQAYTVSAYARKSPAGGASPRVDWTWYTAAGAVISSTTGTSYSATGTWGRWSQTNTAPALAAYGQPRLAWSGTALVGQVLELAQAQCETGDTATSYFDGGYPGAEWTGAANASASLLPTPGSTDVTVSTAGAAWGLWVKIPGRADMVTRVGLQSVGEMARATLGGSWQVPGGVAIAQSAAASLAQSAGLGSLSATLQVLTADAGQTAALWQIIAQAPGQVVMLQTGQPEELPSGYYQVVNPAQGTIPISPGLYGRRPFTLPITEAVMPAGSGTGLFGAAHDDIAQSFSSHTEIAATVGSHLELAQGAWS